jgi:fatty acid desaturase
MESNKNVLKIIWAQFMTYLFGVFCVIVGASGTFHYSLWSDTSLGVLIMIIGTTVLLSNITIQVDCKHKENH